MIIIGDLFVFLGTSDNFWIRSICVLEILTLFVNIVRNCSLNFHLLMTFSTKEGIWSHSTPKCQRACRYDHMISIGHNQYITYQYNKETLKGSPVDNDNLQHYPIIIDSDTLEPLPAG